MILFTPGMLQGTLSGLLPEIKEDLGFHFFFLNKDLLSLSIIPFTVSRKRGGKALWMNMIRAGERNITRRIHLGRNIRISRTTVLRPWKTKHRGYPGKQSGGQPQPSPAADGWYYSHSWLLASLMTATLRTDREQLFGKPMLLKHINITQQLRKENKHTTDRKC